MQRQLDILHRQDELMQRRADLSVRVVVKRPDQTDANLRLEFLVKNSGNRSANDFYWHTYIPTQFSRNQNFSVPRTGDVAPFQTLDVEGIEYRHFATVYKEPAYPGREVPIGHIVSDNPTAGGQYEIHWQVIAEDGRFPPDGRLGRLLVQI